MPSSLSLLLLFDIVDNSSAHYFKFWTHANALHNKVVGKEYPVDFQKDAGLFFTWRETMNSYPQENILVAKGHTASIIHMFVY